MERICHERVGRIREDFWLHGDDVEYTARIARQFRAIFCPAATVEHYWGRPFDRRCPERSAYFKACAALQNNLFMLLHLLHTRFILRSFFGSLKRFVQLHLRSALRLLTISSASSGMRACVQSRPVRIPDVCCANVAAITNRGKDLE